MPPLRKFSQSIAAAGSASCFVTLKISENGVGEMFEKFSLLLLKWVGNNALSYQTKVMVYQCIDLRMQNALNTALHSMQQQQPGRSDSRLLETSALSTSLGGSSQPRRNVFGGNVNDGSILANSERRELNREELSTSVVAGEVNMDPPSRPPLKLRLSTASFQQNTNGEPESPNPQSAVRTPSIKLKFGSKSGSATSPPPAAVKIEPDDNVTPSSAKKRKRNESTSGAVKPAPIRKISLITSKANTPTVASATPVFKLKTKGKIPKRNLGVGYDSELEEREADPVILEAFILRMKPGPDADYVKEAIEKGTVGISRLQGGADIRLRFLDVHGRRGVMFVRGHQYAITVVDLPTITEGMKSWDKKNFMKSVDISQLCIVLGPCNNDEEARNYPLPPGVNPKNFQYAHGLTAPMKNVRKRRFERTTRARVDEIESIERRVQQLLQADDNADSVSYQVMDHDPRNLRDQYSPDYDSDQDAEGEDEEMEGDSYFPLQQVDTPQAQVTAEDVEDYTKLFEIEGDEEDGGAAGANGHLPVSAITNATGGSFSAVASVAASPSDVAGETPLGDAADGPSSDEDEASDEDADEERREGDDQRSQTLDRIRDLNAKIKEHEESLRRSQSQVLRKKLARKITELRSDVEVMQRNLGIDGEEDEDGDEGDT